MSTSTFNDDDGGMSQAERELFSLYTQYPEIDFDDSEEPAVLFREPTSPGRVPAPVDSSPLSTVVDQSQTTLCSNSTAHTTPLRRPLLRQTQNIVDPDTVESYLYLVQHTDLPGPCLQYFTGLAQSIHTVSTGFTPSSNGRYRINNTFFVDACEELLREVQAPLARTTEQIQQLARLKSLVLFQADPADDCLWSTSTSIPSAAEKKLIHHLARLCDTRVYRPFQQLVDEDEIEHPTRLVLNSIYDALFTWLARYGRWCGEMTDLKQRYMQPLARRILASPDVVAEIRRDRAVRDVAQAAVDCPEAPGLRPMDERTLMALNLSARRREAQVKAPKKRYRREKTI